jgi:hypothetical protein
MIAAALVCVIGALVTTYLGGALVAYGIDRFAKEWKAGGLARGFPEGGKLIGQLERFLIYLLVVSGNAEGVGFLIAAKSVFRFGELTDVKNDAGRKEAEYITIGTLMSFACGLAMSLVFKLILDEIVAGGRAN